MVIHIGGIITRVAARFNFRVGVLPQDPGSPSFLDQVL